MHVTHSSNILTMQYVQITDLIYTSLTSVLIRMKMRYRKAALPATYSKIRTHVTFDKEDTKTYAMMFEEELCTMVNATKQYQQLIL